MSETTVCPGAVILPRLYQEFAQFYTAERCRWAPANPRRIFNLVFKKLYPKVHHRLSAEQVLAEVYATLGFRGSQPPGLFETFDPAKYHGTRPLEDHFVALFARKLKGRLGRAAKRRANAGRAGELRLLPAREDANPAFAAAVLDLPAVLGCLDARERGVVHLTYWEDLSARAVGALLGLDHKTVGRLHDTALRKLRRGYEVEESLAA